MMTAQRNPILAALLLLSGCRDSEGGASPGDGQGTAAETETDTSETTASEPPDSGDDEGDTGDTSGATDESESDESDESDDGSDLCSIPEFECPPDAMVVGQSGQIMHEELEIVWEPSTACGLSVGPVTYVRLDDDTVSFGLSVEHGGANSGFGLVQLDDEIVIDFNALGDTGWGAPPTGHFPVPVGSVVFPMSPETTPRGGCLAVWPVSEGEAGEAGVLHLVSRRAEGQGILDLDLVVVGDQTISEQDLDEALVTAAQLYFDGNAAQLGDLRLHTVDADSALFPFEGEQLDALRASFVPDDPTAATVYVISDFIGLPGLLGTAGGVPGPNGVSGTAASGVVVGVEGHRRLDGILDTVFLGETIAHELGHQLGLFHTTEADGAFHDLAPDTAECTLADDANGDGMLAAAECPDGNNFMFWSGGMTPQTEVSPFQSDVIFFSPIVE